MTQNYIYEEDTIVAISTPIGTGGLGIVRMSGKKSIDIAKKIFVPYKKNKIVEKIPTFSVTLGNIVDGKNIFDEVLMTIMRAPKSYTCEDVVEFSCHGGILILQKVVELCLKYGARLAQPGEFTKRAFLNGRIDLSQAEAVAEVINSKNLIQTKLATNSLLGKTKQFVENIVQKLKSIIAEVEVTLEYPDDEKFVNEKKITQKMKNVVRELKNVISNSEKLLPLMNQVNIAIIGKPNVGKSSLLNVLLQQDRVIVSPIPGTTRDTISEVINIGGITARIVDTAGIRDHSQDLIEKIGIERTKNAIKEADLIFFMLDAKCGISNEDFYIAELISLMSNEIKKMVVILINKIDLKPNYNKSHLSKLTKKLRNIKLAGIIEISCKKLLGIKKVENSVIKCLGLSSKKEVEKVVSSYDQTNVVLTNLRQISLIKSALDEINNSLKHNLITQPELFCHHLSTATKELLKISGGEFTEDILNIIFSKFCVGK